MKIENRFCPLMKGTCWGRECALTRMELEYHGQEIGYKNAWMCKVSDTTVEDEVEE